jgi:phosphoribosylglycinamide formyltransferase-1
MSQTVAVLASGGGSNLQAILDAIASGDLDARVVLVASNREQAGALERARVAGVRAEHVPRGDDYDSRLHDLLVAAGPDLVVLAGYLRLIDPVTVRAWRGRMLNIHPALLPAFGGKGMYGIHVHEAVLEYGVRVTGVTVHLVDEQYDRGAIVAQVPVPVMDDDTPESLQARVLEKEHALYPRVLQWFAQGRVEVDGRKVSIR